MQDLIPFQEVQKEAAKAFGKETANQIFSFLSDIIRPPARELGGLLADHMGWFRFKTQMKIIKKAKCLLDEQNIQAQEVPIKPLSKLLEYCSWEEDESMQEKWAILLANFAASGENPINHISFVDILNQISPIQAKYLDLMYDELFFPARRDYRTWPSYQSTHRLADILEIDEYASYIICDSLMRLNLIKPDYNFKPEDRDISYSKVEISYESVTLTHLGNEFVRKCRIPFSKFHIEKIDKILSKMIDKIAMDPRGTEYKNFCVKTKSIHPNIIDNDIAGGVMGALNKFIWKGGKIDDFKGYRINSEERKEIVAHAIDEIWKCNHYAHHPNRSTRA